MPTSVRPRELPALKITGRFRFIAEVVTPNGKGSTWPNCDLEYPREQHDSSTPHHRGHDRVVLLAWPDVLV